MPTVTSKISGRKMYCIEFKNFCTLHICRDMEYGYPPYTKHTEAFKDNMDSYLYDIDYGQFFSKNAHSN